MTTTFRIDDGLKNDCDAILDNIGLNMSSAITIFLKELSRRRAMPFELRADPVVTQVRMVPEREPEAFATRLEELPKKYSEADWDGNGAEPLNPEAYSAAKNFVTWIPGDLRWADIDVDADGDVVFEWFKAKDLQCSLTFSPGGKVYCLVKERGRKMTATFISPPSFKLLAMISEVFRG